MASCMSSSSSLGKESFLSITPGMTSSALRDSFDSGNDVIGSGSSPSKKSFSYPSSKSLSHFPWTSSSSVVSVMSASKVLPVLLDQFESHYLGDDSFFSTMNGVNLSRGKRSTGLSMQSSSGNSQTSDQSTRSTTNVKVSGKQMTGVNPRMYHEPDSEPISPKGTVARPWITWVKGMQSAAPVDFRSIIMSIFQRVVAMFFSGGVGGGGGGLSGGLLPGLGGRQMSDRRAKMQEFKKTLASEISGALHARSTGQLDHYLQARGLTTASPSSTRLAEQKSQINHSTASSSPTRLLTPPSQLEGRIPTVSPLAATFLRQNIEHEGEKIILLSRSTPKSHLGRKRRSLFINDILQGLQGWQKEISVHENHS